MLTLDPEGSPPTVGTALGRALTRALTRTKTVDVGTREY